MEYHNFIELKKLFHEDLFNFLNSKIIYQKICSKNFNFDISKIQFQIMIYLF
jgi:hypothetical protein